MFFSTCVGINTLDNGVLTQRNSSVTQLIGNQYNHSCVFFRDRRERTHVANMYYYFVGLYIDMGSYVCGILGLYRVLMNVCKLY